MRNTIPVDKAFFESMGFKNMPDGRYNINLTTIEECTATNTNYVATLYESTIAVSVSEGEITYYTPYIEVSYTNSLNVGDLVYPIVVTILS